MLYNVLHQIHPDIDRIHHRQISKVDFDHFDREKIPSFSLEWKTYAIRQRRMLNNRREEKSKALLRISNRSLFVLTHAHAHFFSSSAYE